MKKVIVYKTNLLAYSETFIKDQVLALRDWHPVLVGMKSSPTGLNLSDIDVRLCADLKQSVWQRLRWSIAKHFYLPHPGLASRLAAERAQLVHVHFGTEAVHFWPTAKALGLPLLVTLHGFDINTRRDYWESGKGGSWMKAYPRRLLDMAHAERVKFIAVSQAIRDSAMAFGIPAERIVVRHIGIDLTRFSPGKVPMAKRAHRVLFTGRLVEKKGVAHLIRAMAQVRQSVPDAELIIAGDGPLRESLGRLADQLHCRVTFLGPVSPDEVKRQLDQSRVFCLPSITAANGDAEGFGMVILEAQACGVPVVTSARGGSTEGIVHGETGFAHREGDVEQLAHFIVRLLTDDSLAQAFALAAREHVERHFDILRCTRALEQTYDEMCEVP